MQAATLHRPPTHPHRWWGWLLASQLLVVAVWIWLGWRIGLPLLLASHALVMWGVLWPRSSLYGPVRRRVAEGVPQLPLSWRPP